MCVPCSVFRVPCSIGRWSWNTDRGPEIPIPGEMGHLRRLGGRWSALGGAWPDPKGPGRWLPTTWVPWVRAVPIGLLRWPGGRSRGPESAVLPSGAVVGTHPVRPCTCTMRPTQVPELPVAGPYAPRGPTRSLGWATGGCFGLDGACGVCFLSTRQIPLFFCACGDGRWQQVRKRT